MNVLFGLEASTQAADVKHHLNQLDVEFDA
jgi:hypothetical protein